MDRDTNCVEGRTQLTHLQQHKCSKWSREERREDKQAHEVCHVPPQRAMGHYRLMCPDSVPLCDVV